MTTPYRTAPATYTLDELTAEEERADRELSASVDALRETRDAYWEAKHRRDRRCKNATAALALMVVVAVCEAPMLAVAASTAIACITMHDAIAAIGRWLRAKHVLGEAMKRRNAACDRWHVASSRAFSERMRVEFGWGSRCACPQCETDQLGFFAPFSKTTD